LAGGCGEEQIVQVGTEDADRFRLGALAQRVHQFQFEVQRDLDAPGPAHRVGEPFVGRPATVDDAGVQRDARLAGVGAGRFFLELAVEDQSQLQHALRCGRGRAPARDAREWRGAPPIGKIVLELGRLALLAGDDGRLDEAVLFEKAAQFAEQAGVSENCSIRIWRAPSSTLRTSAKPASALR
jgi:hypothetical protein